jgi:YHS domain-containing protein
MKRIVLNRYSIPDKNSVYIRNKYYHVYLGNEQTYYFSSKENVHMFLRETTDMINEVLCSLNNLYTEVFSEFREFWIYDNTNIDRHIFKKFESLNNIFSRSIKRSVEINVFSFKNMYLIIEEITTISTIMIKAYDKKFIARINKLHFINEQLNYVKQKLDTWDSSTTTSLPVYQ